MEKRAVKKDRVGFGGSCHWCTEAIFQQVKGVVKVDQGWISSRDYPTFSEAVEVYYDPEIISLKTLIEIHLYSHSSTSQHSMREKYRSAIYVFDEEQYARCLSIVQRLQDQFDRPIITKVLFYEGFQRNEERYLNYYQENPEKAFCKNVIDPKLQALLRTHRKFLKSF